MTWSNLKANKGECGGRQDNCTAEGCPVFGTLREARDGRSRAPGCMDPAGRGRQNKRTGSRRQAKALTGLGIPRSSLRPGNEETLPGSVRTEIKAGAQVRPVLTRYLAAETQSESQRPFGDHRPFVAVFMPDGLGDGLVTFRLSKLDDVLVALAEQRGLVP